MNYIRPTLEQLTFGQWFWIVYVKCIVLRRPPRWSLSEGKYLLFLLFSSLYLVVFFFLYIHFFAATRQNTILIFKNRFIAAGENFEQFTVTIWISLTILVFSEHFLSQFSYIYDFSHDFHIYNFFSSRFPYGRFQGPPPACREGGVLQKKNDFFVNFLILGPFARGKSQYFVFYFPWKIGVFWRTPHFASRETNYFEKKTKFKIKDFQDFSCAFVQILEAIHVFVFFQTIKKRQILMGKLILQNKKC